MKNIIGLISKRRENLNLRLILEFEFKTIQKSLVSALLLICFLTSCETEFTPESIENAEQIVVEGYIEAGENAGPTYVILTKSLPFFDEINQETFNNIFINDAEVKVFDGENEFILSELCISELTPEQMEIASEFLGVDANSEGVEFCVYIDLFQQITPEIGGRYDLTVKIGEETLTATTTIPELVALDSLKFIPSPGEDVDTLAQLEAYVQDPAGIDNYYRYSTQINSEPMIGGVPSVTDDRLFDGQFFAFPIAKAERRDAEFNTTTYGYYFVGDTLTMRWANVDKEHFDFWNTLEFNALNQGPFSSYTRVDSNIEGGIGIWGGYATKYYTLIVEK